IPFVINDRLWVSGIGGAIPSMTAFVFACLGIFSLTLRAVGSRVAAGIATLAFLANPNLLYLQSTGMTEALYLALFVLAIYFLLFALAISDDREAADHHALLKAGGVLALAMLTRYDAWFLAVGIAILVLLIWVRPGSTLRRDIPGRELLLFFAILAVVPVL